MAKEEKNWYDDFLKLLETKFTKKHELVEGLMNLLFIEREAVYRRLRQDVIFSAHEIATIASAWNISLDDVMTVNPGLVAFQMQRMNFLNPSEMESNIIRKVIKGLHYSKDFPTSEIIDVGNKLPRQFLAGYLNLNKFYLFKWSYQYGNNDEVIPFSQIVLSEEITNLTKEYQQAIKLMPTSYFIWDRRLFDNLVSDIQYFASIRMITNAEKALIKQDLNDLLNYLQEVATKGFYPETHNKVNLYISNLHVDTNYNFTYTPEASICFVFVFEKFEIHSFNKAMTADFRTWMHLKKRSSTQISEVDERSRIEYFTRQRELVNTL